MTHVAVLKGGRSLERQVSLKSGGNVEHALERLGHEVTGVDVGSDLVARLRAVRPDVAFIALHGRDGEDGTVQELLELLGIPYTGSRVGACILCADKVLAKHQMVAAGVPTPEFVAFTDAAFRELGAGEALDEVERALGFPLVVKPSDQGSAMGIKFAADRDAVPGAIVSALSYSDKVLLERHVDGRDLAVSVLDGVALPVVEAVPLSDEFYDFEARYEIGRTDFVCPADLSPALTERAQQLAVRVHELLGCTGVSRVDIMLEGDDLAVLEVNTVPGMTATSLLPQAAEAAGIGFDELVGRILASAA